MSYSHHNQTRRRLLKGAVATWLLSVSGVGLAAAAQVIAVRVWPSSAYTRITLESNRMLKYKQFMLTDPNRLVVDIKDIQLNSVLKTISQQFQSDNPLIKKARIGQFYPKTVRLVLELKQATKPKVFTLNPIAKFKHRLVLDLYPAVWRDDNIDDKSLALLEDYNNGDLESKLMPEASLKGKAGCNRPLVVMLDPGHGGEDPGAIGKNRTREKDIVLRIARRLRSLIEREPNMKAYMTRNEDAFIPLRVRMAKARKQHADLFVSIHADAFTNRAACGSSVFALSKKGATSTVARFLAETQNESDLIGGVSMSGDRYLDHMLLDLVQTATISDSLKFGGEILKRLGKVNQLHKNTVDQAGFAVLKAPDIPSILIETAFISNLEEERKLRTSHFQQQIAESILAGIKAYFVSTGNRKWGAYSILSD